MSQTRQCYNNKVRHFMKMPNPHFELLDLDQGSAAWKQERMKRVTASQIPVLMRLSPYQTPLELLKEKITGVEAEVSPFKQRIFDQGHLAEKSAREWIEENFKIKFPPAVVLSKRCPDLLASLDGFNEEKNIILEAKFMGAKALEEVKANKIKPHHECQVQAQLLATGADKCIYFATTEDGDSAIAEIKPNPEYAANISSAVNEFVVSIEEYLQVKRKLISKYSPKVPKGELCRVRSRYGKR